MKTIHHNLCAMISGGIAEMSINNNTIFITITGESAFSFSEGVTLYSDHVCIADSCYTITDGYEYIYAGVPLFQATAINGMVYNFPL